jgi:hypothetical protein
MKEFIEMDLAEERAYQIGLRYQSDISITSFKTEDGQI